jgi:hypothetical protein
MTGRAGRDGLPSRGIMFWAPKDLTTLNFLATHTNGSEQPDGRTAQQQAGANMAKIQEVQRFARQVRVRVITPLCLFPSLLWGCARGGRCSRRRGRAWRKFRRFIYVIYEFYLFICISCCLFIYVFIYLFVYLFIYWLVYSFK